MTIIYIIFYWLGFRFQKFKIISFEKSTISFSLNWCTLDICTAFLPHKTKQLYLNLRQTRKYLSELIIDFSPLILSDFNTYFWLQDWKWFQCFKFIKICVDNKSVGSVQMRIVRQPQQQQQQQKRTGKPCFCNVIMIEFRLKSNELKCKIIPSCSKMSTAGNGPIPKTQLPTRS